jgi:DNA primase
MGTALTAEQVQNLRRLTSNIYLALDADAAGIRAAEKGLDSILQTSEAQLVVQGATLQWAVDLDLAVKIIRLPSGKDPDDLVRADPEQWRALVRGALPVVDFFFELYTEGLELRNPEHQQRALVKLAPIVAAIKDFAKRAVYESRLADLLHMPFPLIQASVLEITRQRRDRRPSGPGQRPAPPAQPSINLDPFAHEDELLSLLLRFPQIRQRVEGTLAGELESFPDLRDDIPATLRDAFTRIENRVLWYAWSEHGESGPADVVVWLGSLDPALRPQAERLLQWQDRPTLREASPLIDARERAKNIAERLRQTIAKRRRAEMASLTRTVEDDETWNQLARKLQLVLDYSNVVTAPRRSTVFQDLGSRREEFG